MLSSGNTSYKKEENVSLWLSIKAVFLGITVSIFTPNRVGEFWWPRFCLEKANRIKAILITILGNMGQLLATIIFEPGLGVLPIHLLRFFRWRSRLLVYHFVICSRYHAFYVGSSVFKCLLVHKFFQ